MLAVQIWQCLTECYNKDLPWSVLKICVHAKLCPTLCNPMDCSLPGSSIHGILQARMLERVTLPSSRRYSQPRIEPTSLTSPALAGRFFTTNATWETPRYIFSLFRNPLMVIFIIYIYTLRFCSGSQPKNIFIFYWLWLLPFLAHEN